MTFQITVAVVYFAPMEGTEKTTQHGARLPRALGLPLRLVPGVLHSTVLAAVLDRVLAVPMRDGELEFMHGRTVAICVEDAGIEYRLFHGVSGFYAGMEGRDPDVTMSGSLYDFLILALRQEDPDTLFFQRRLRIEGDTAIGLQVKNLLDSLDIGPADLPESVQRSLERALAGYERLFS